MTINTIRVETELDPRLRSIAHRYRSWRITEHQMREEVRQAVSEAMRQVTDLMKNEKEAA